METTKSIAQVPPIRSSRGCWTCRLRKKKCDEVFPGCLRCASVNIECHYGPKPTWIENSALGKAELERIKTVVGASASRKRAAFRAKIRRTSDSASPRHPAQNTHPLSPPDQSTNARRDGFTPADSEEKLSGNTIEVVVPPIHLNRPKCVDDHEASLMMHYLDHVFFIQFRFYPLSIAAGVRGWLLSLLTRTKPLYHAALSLSAFHRQSLLCLTNDAGEAKTNYLQELEQHHNLTLKELQLFIKVHSENGSTRRAFEGNVQILACMVQLISFELFNGGVSSNWQVHLRAASELILSLHGLSAITNVDNLTPKRQCTPSSPDSNFNPVSSLLSPDNTALSFFTGAIIWFDILACVSTGSQPHLFDYHDRLLFAQSLSTPIDMVNQTIELQIIMGCKNWAMVAIGEIAQLRTWRQKAIDSGTLDIHQVADTAKSIQLHLERNISKIGEDLDALRDEYSGPPPHYCVEMYSKYTHIVITQMFACAALIYLQTVVSSDPSILSIQVALQSVMSAMSMIPDPRMFRGLVWPLCVAGCMAASSTDQEFFRASAAGAVEDSRRFGNSGHALEILEKSWEMQRERGRLIDCAQAIQALGTCILLV